MLFQLAPVCYFFSLLKPLKHLERLQPLAFITKYLPLVTSKPKTRPSELKNFRQEKKIEWMAKGFFIVKNFFRLCLKQVKVNRLKLFKRADNAHSRRTFLVTLYNFFHLWSFIFNSSSIKFCAVLGNKTVF